jgi:hypothetical protein
VLFEQFNAKVAYFAKKKNITKEKVKKKQNGIFVSELVY